jgi:hypothetical protein
MDGTAITLLIVFIVLGIFFKMGPEEAPAEQAAEPESAPAPEAAPPEPPASSGGEQDSFKPPE